MILGMIECEDSKMPRDNTQLALLNDELRLKLEAYIPLDSSERAYAEHELSCLIENGAFLDPFNSHALDLMMVLSYKLQSQLLANYKSHSSSEQRMQMMDWIISRDEVELFKIALRVFDLEAEVELNKVNALISSIQQQNKILLEGVKKEVDSRINVLNTQHLASLAMFDRPSGSDIKSINSQPPKPTNLKKTFGSIFSKEKKDKKYKIDRVEIGLTKGNHG